MTKEKSAPPWKKKAPVQSSRTKLTAASKQKARMAARKAGRNYPNLVDNMNAAKKQRASAKKS